MVNSADHQVVTGTGAMARAMAMRPGGRRHRLCECRAHSEPGGHRRRERAGDSART